MPLSTRRALVVKTENEVASVSIRRSLTVLYDGSPSPKSIEKRIKTAEESTIVTPSPKKSKKSSSNKALVSRSAPDNNWEDIWSLVVELRSDRTAPCDLAGAEALPDRSAHSNNSPKGVRFQILMSLMLSSQTKDATVAAAIRHMQQDKVLCVEQLSTMTAATLDSYINKVGFHNNKTRFIKQVVEILKEKYEGDIPPTAAAMMELPGVGPKMAFIAENVAWNKQTGIGVDTHMHRLFNILHWVDAKNAEQTRLQLESWLPRDKWTDVNLLWVGFGQEVQQLKPKMLRKALDCSRPKEALRLLKRCGLDCVKEGRKLGMDEKVRAALRQD